MIAKRITAGICAIALTVGMGQSVGAFADDVSIGNDHVASAVSSTDDISEGKVKFYSSYSNTAESVTLKWKALDGADGYKLYRHYPAKDKWVLVANTKE
ncbi:MAG: hypothetical protein IJ740_16740, partial [Ruminococcus sp.]|nr:hypothetical protein [Ruminococcus sp.]